LSPRGDKEPRPMRFGTFDRVAAGGAGRREKPAPQQHLGATGQLGRIDNSLVGFTTVTLFAGVLCFCCAWLSPLF